MDVIGAEAFFAGDFLEATFFLGIFLAGVFFAAAFLAGAFFAAGFFVTTFFSSLSRALASLSINFSRSDSNLSSFLNNSFTNFFWL